MRDRTLAPITVNETRVVAVRPRLVAREYAALPVLTQPVKVSHASGLSRMGEAAHLAGTQALLHVPEMQAEPRVIQPERKRGEPSLSDGKQEARGRGQGRLHLDVNAP